MTLNAALAGADSRAQTHSWKCQLPRRHLKLLLLPSRYQLHPPGSTLTHKLFLPLAVAGPVGLKPFPRCP